MPFTRPTLTEIDERIQADFKNRIEGITSLLRRSVLKIQARVYAGACHLLYGYLQYQKNQMFLTTAETDNLELIANEYGVSRKAAEKATGSGTATGTIGVVIPANTELINSADLSYFTDEAYTIDLAGTVEVFFTAEAVGTDYNDDSGISLSFVSPIAGIDSIITVGTSGIDGGLDEEIDDDYRARGLARKRQPSHGGAYFDYESWALEVAGVTRAWALPQYYGAGTVGLAFARDNDASIIPSVTEKLEVHDYLVSHTDPVTGQTVDIPVAAEPGLIMVDTELQTLDFTIKLYPNNATVLAEVTEKLDSLIFSKGGPGETLYLSEMDAVISASASEVAHKLIYPTADISVGTNKIPVLGTITPQEYI